MASTTTKPRQGKTAKGLLAAGLGAALLLGTGGTFALWQASDDIPRTTFQTGHMKLDANNFNWRTYVLDADGSPRPAGASASGYVLVPGTRVVGETVINADLLGTNLTATLEMDGGAVTGASSPIIVDVQVNRQPAANFDYVQDLEPGKHQVHLKVTIEFPRGVDYHYLQGAKGKTITLDALSVTLTQNPPVPLVP